MAKGGPHPLTGHLPPDRPHWGGEPLPTDHTPPGASLAKRGGGPSPTGHPLATASPTGQRRGRPPIGQTGAPHSLATHWPPTGHKGAAIGGRPSHRPSLAPHWAKGTGGGKSRPPLPTPTERLGGGKRGGYPAPT